MIAWSIASLAFLIAGARAIQQYRLALNHDALVGFMTKLLARGGLDRPRKIVQAIGGAMVATPLEKTLDALEHTPVMERAVVLRRTFDESFEPRAIQLHNVSMLADPVAILLAISAIGAAYKLTGVAPFALVALSAAAALVAGWAMFSARATVRGGRKVRDELMPALVSFGTGVATYREPEPGKEEVHDLHVTVFRGSEVIARHVLFATVVKVGRDARADILLDDDEVSRMHAVLENADGVWQIIDLGSGSGTLVRGERVNKAPLSDGDAFEIGPFRVQLGVASTEAEVEDEAFFFGFEERAPDLFHEILVSIARRVGRPLHVKKIKRASSPRWAVAVVGAPDALAEFRRTFEANIEGAYRRHATPRQDIAPDATYGPETRTAVTLRAELRNRAVEVVVDDLVP